MKYRTNRTIYNLKSHKTKRGVVLTTELILLLTAVIAIVVLAAYGLGRTVLSQATSSKNSLVVEQANVWYLGSYRQNGKTYYTFAITIYVQNVGNQQITIDNGGITLAGGTANNPLNIQINPGETKEISFTVNMASSNSISISTGSTSAYVYVQTSNNNQIGTATVIQSPS